MQSTNTKAILATLSAIVLPSDLDTFIIKHREFLVLGAIALVLGSVGALVLYAVKVVGEAVDQQAAVNPQHEALLQAEAQMANEAHLAAEGLAALAEAAVQPVIGVVRMPQQLRALSL